MASFSETVDIFTFVELANCLIDILGVEVDLVMKDAILFMFERLSSLSRRHNQRYYKYRRVNSNMTYDDFAKDKKTIDAAIRNFEIVGEATK